LSSVSPDRLDRFGDWRQLQRLCLSGLTPEERPFFAGRHVADRMDSVRRAINEIRTNWHRYDTFMLDLRESFLTQDNRASMGDLLPELEALLASIKSWESPPGQLPHDDFSAIRLYSSAAGYRLIFDALNRAFRSVRLPDDERRMRCAVFLVELLTIDLFNYRRFNPQADDFQAVVYRGMSVSAEQLEMFRRASLGHVEQRYLSIPLGLASASTDSDLAATFALSQRGRHSNQHALVWKINVASLDRESFEIYKSVAPDSIVTSICAVPIDALSPFPTEKEVLLRGPFFQILGLEMAHARFGNDVHMVEAMMMNSNRDHITALASNEGDDRRVRDLFRALVSARRAGLCAEWAADRGMADDTDAYQAIALANRRTIESYL
jgi:hypothetical protein